MKNYPVTKVCIISTVHNALDNRIFYREASSLSKASYQVCVIAIHDKAETIEGILIQPVKRVRRILRPLLWITVLSSAISTGADIFHIHDPELLFISPFIRLLTRRPVIYDIHESFSDFLEIKDDLPVLLRNFLAWLFSWLEPFLAHLQSGLIFADDEIASAFKNVDVPKTTIFNYPLESFINQAKRKTSNKDNNEPIVLYLGGIKRHRGTSLMLEAFKIVLDTVPQAKLYIVGPFAPTSLEIGLHTEINKLNMDDSIILTGGVPYQQVNEYLAKASVGWIPFPPVKKYQKNIPTKLFEYMAYSIPVVSSDLPPMRLFIKNGKSGLLVEADDPRAHAAAIISLLTQPDHAKQIGKISFELVSKRFRWTEMEPLLLNLYAQVLNKYE